jgi:hypothetical protein
MAKFATLASSLFLSACATGRYGWMDHTALILRPSHKQALVAYSFGGGEQASRDNASNSRTVAASLAAAMTVNDNPLPTIDTVDLKGGRFYIHTPRTK